VLSSLGIERAEVIEGRFEDVLDRVLAEAEPVDLVYLDAGKGRGQNLGLFERVLPHLSSNAALVMDDIHWSREMKMTWRKIAGHPRVALSVDLWRLGACLLTANPSAQRKASM
jgi:predicted O-methyltransferase YrrM